MKTHATYLAELRDKVKEIEIDKEKLKIKIEEIENAKKNI